MDGIIRLLGRDPHSYEDRVALGDHAKATNDKVGAIFEYQEALKLQENPEISARLKEAIAEAR